MEWLSIHKINRKGIVAGVNVFPWIFLPYWQTVILSLRAVVLGNSVTEIPVLVRVVLKWSQSYCKQIFSHSTTVIYFIQYKSQRATFHFTQITATQQFFNRLQPFIFWLCCSFFMLGWIACPFAHCASSSIHVYCTCAEIERGSLLLKFCWLVKLNCNNVTKTMRKNT